VLTTIVLNPHYLVIAPNPEVFDTDLLSSLSFSWLTIGVAWMIGRRAFRDRTLEDRPRE
jgi:hypothetical protein